MPLFGNAWGFDNAIWCVSPEAFDAVQAGGLKGCGEHSDHHFL